MSVRLPVYDPESKRDMEGESRRRSEHAAALEASCGRVTRYVSEALGTAHFSMRTLEEQMHGDARTASEVVEIEIQTARDCGKPEAEAAAPLFVLARRLGYAVSSLPASPRRDPDVVGKAADASVEFSQAIGASLELVRGRLSSPLAIDRARKEIPEAIDALWKLARDVDDQYALQVETARNGASARRVPVGGGEGRPS